MYYNLKKLYNKLFANSMDALPPLKPIIPCPFDGKESVLRYNGYLSYYYIECTHCSAVGIYHPSKDVVVNHWNNRMD